MVKLNVAVAAPNWMFDGVATAVTTSERRTVRQLGTVTGLPPVVGVTTMEGFPDGTFGSVNRTWVFDDDVTVAGTEPTMTVGVPVAPKPEPVRVIVFEPV